MTEKALFFWDNVEPVTYRKTERRRNDDLQESGEN